MSRTERMLLLILVFALAGACSKPSAPEARLSDEAMAACSELGRFARDSSDGILTYSEQRDRIKELYDKAKGSEVEVQARALLAAWTQISPSGATESLRQFTLSCTGVDIAVPTAEPSAPARREICKYVKTFEEKLLPFFTKEQLADVWSSQREYAKGTVVEREVTPVFLAAAGSYRTDDDARRAVRDKLGPLKEVCAAYFYR